ncbi:MAG: DUF3862 domain-containing protein [Gammaproteobacteria bacterium]
MGNTTKHLTFALFLLLLSGCDRVNRQNYDKLEMGMPYDEVVAMLGEPANCKSVLMAKSCVWGGESKKIDIKFADNKVVLFSSAGL